MKKNTPEILRRFDEHYGTEVKMYLHHENAWQLLFATMLSAQCTDERVNMVTPGLFKKYPSVQASADAKLSELEKDIHSTGFYHNKAKNMIAAAKMLISDYGGEVPSDIDELIKLPGVGRKTANVIRGNIYGIPSIVVDTHVGRISRHLGFTKETDPVKVEYALYKEIPEDRWILWNIQAIAHGRSICPARNPRCAECFVNDLCPDGKKLLKSKNNK